jgi:ABC-type transport system substrate-binding protein
VNEPAKRKAAYEKALTQIEPGKPLIYLYHQHWVFAYSAKTEGYRQPPDGIIRPQDIRIAK